MHKLIHGDCLEELKNIPENSVDSIVTDPPYGLSFMGKKWDYDVPSVEIWRECIRVLKPGGHLLAFGGTRTYHRMVVNIEDAGFEIRDQILWLYGSGFPKSLNISKALDKEAGAERKVVGINPNARPNSDGVYDAIMSGKAGHDPNITAPATPEAAQWDGWGTALKPANEPICLARKPLGEKTVAANVLKHGTGGLNIDWCRVSTSDNLNGGAYSNGKKDLSKATSYATGVSAGEFEQPSGRWPANVILTHHPECELLGMKKVKAINGENSTPPYASDTTWNISNTDGQQRKQIGDENGEETVEDWKCHEDCPVGMFPETKSGNLNKGHKPNQDNRIFQKAGSERTILKDYGGDQGSAARFFKNFSIDEEARRFMYCAKASKQDRNEGLGKLTNVHPTVKPTALCSYLCRLVTPPGGTVLDPFMGSGSTGKAAMMEGFNFVGIEKELEYIEIAKARIEHAEMKSEKGVDEMKFIRNWFSNFEKMDTPLMYQEIPFWTIENFYQAMKTEKTDIETRKQIAAMSPWDAKRFGKKVQIRSDWEEVKVEIMRYALKHKFAKGTKWANELKNHPEPIVEINNWHDNIWGSCICERCNNRGRNLLGQLIEEMRILSQEE